MKKRRELTTLKIGDYILQLSVVILGVIVTFGGSTLLSERAKAKEIANTMEMIKIELEMNKKDIQEISQYLAAEQKMSRYLLHFENNLSEASEDTLKMQLNFPFRINRFKARTDALEMFKMSSLAQQIQDKKLILQIIKTYTEIKAVEDVVKWYYDLKSKYLEELKNDKNYLNKEKEFINTYTSKSIRQLWELRLSSFTVYNVLQFINGAREFQEGFPTAETAIEESIQIIENSYGKN